MEQSEDAALEAPPREIGRRPKGAPTFGDIVGIEL